MSAKGSRIPPGTTLPGKRGKRRPTAKSPRVPARVTSNSAVDQPGSPFAGDSGFVGPLVGVAAAFTETARVRRPRTNTNATQKHGGESTFARPDTETFCRESLLYPSATTGPRPSTSVRVIFHYGDYSDSARVAGDHEGVRAQAMSDHATLTALGAAGLSVRWVNSTDRDDPGISRRIPVVTPYWPGDISDDAPPADDSGAVPAEIRMYGGQVITTPPADSTESE